MGITLSPLRPTRGKNRMRNPPRAAPFFFLTVSSLALASVLCLFSCSGKSKIAGMDFPPTYIVEGRERFAVVTHPYGALRDRPGESGVTLGHCRKGDVFAVTGISFVGTGGNRVLWVCLDGGWIQRASVVLFSTRAQAENASRGMRAVDGDDASDRDL